MISFLKVKTLKYFSVLFFTIEQIDTTNANKWV